MKVQGSIFMEYYNRRKVSFEPLLELWKFELNYRNIDGDTHFEIGNADFQTSKNEKGISSQADLHKNSLNINLSTAAIETLMELYHLYMGNMKEAKPYKVINQTGAPLLVMSIRENDRSGYIVADHPKGLSWKFFSRKKYKQVLESNARAFMNLMVLKQEECTKLMLTANQQTSDSFQKNNILVNV